MKALIYNSFGKPDVLEWVGDWNNPAVDANQILVKVIAGSVNPKDVLLRKGKFSKTMARDPLPRVSGMDIAGKIAEVGESITDYKTGDLVYAMTNHFAGGVHSEYALFEADEIAFAPSNISIENAASVPLSALTALQALRDHGKVAKGQKVLINGASGGVGHFAVQIAKIMGAEVHAVCGPAHMDFVKSLGADMVYNYEVKPAPEIDTIFNCVFDIFGKYSRKDFFRQLGQKGVFVSTVPKMATIIGAFFNWIGFYKRSRLVMVKSRKDDLNKLCEWIESKSLIPHVEKIYNITEAKQAHEHIEGKHTTGKIVLLF